MTAAEFEGLTLLKALEFTNPIARADARASLVPNRDLSGLIPPTIQKRAWMNLGADSC